MALSGSAHSGSFWTSKTVTVTFSCECFVCLPCLQHVSEESIRSLQLEFQAAVSCHVAARNRTQVLYLSNKCF